MKVTGLFWGASLEDIKRGFTEDGKGYVCLLCGHTIERGIIYPEDDVLYEADRYMQVHLEKEHGSVFEYLINLDKKLTGLSDHQSNLLRLFYEGKSDLEIQHELGIGSSSTIRNHRFVLKEKERQAKVFLVLMDLLREQDKGSGQFCKTKTDKTVKTHHPLSEAEREKILKKYFPQGINGPLNTLHIKEKNRQVVLAELVKRFDAKQIYSEKQVNSILQTVHEDFGTLRRYLIDYGFMDRKTDNSQYWVNDRSDMEVMNMNRKKELKQQYKEMKTEGGIYQVRNKVNQKILLVSTPNLKTINGKSTGSFMNQELKEDWKKYGPDAFVFEVLEVLEEKDDGFFDKKQELQKLYEKWLEKLQPFGERGYNRDKLAGKS